MSSISFSGNLTRDPEQKTTPNSHLCAFSVAVNTRYRGEDTVAFYDCTAWRGLGDNIAKYFKKGDFIIIESGSLVPITKDGRTYLNVEVHEFKFGPKQVAEWKDPTQQPVEQGGEIPF